MQFISDIIWTNMAVITFSWSALSDRRYASSCCWRRDWL